jgi:hypothetical protein
MTYNKHYVKLDGSIVLIPASFKPFLMIDLFALIASAKKGFEISSLSAFFTSDYTLVCPAIIENNFSQKKVSKNSMICSFLQKIPHTGKNFINRTHRTNRFGMYELREREIEPIDYSIRFQMTPDP